MNLSVLTVNLSELSVSYVIVILIVSSVTHGVGYLLIKRRVDHLKDQLERLERRVENGFAKVTSQVKDVRSEMSQGLGSIRKEISNLQSRISPSLKWKSIYIVSWILCSTIIMFLSAVIVSFLEARKLPETDRKGTIVCTSLMVVDESGESRIILRIGEHGGKIEVTDKKGQESILLDTDEHGGVVSTYGKTENRTGKLP